MKLDMSGSTMRLIELFVCKYFYDGRIVVFVETYRSHELKDAMSGGKDNSLGVMCLRGDSISNIYPLNLRVLRP